MKMENYTFCYCKAIVQEPYMIKCQKCDNLFHARCLRQQLAGGTSLVGDTFFQLTCEGCSPSGQEMLCREKPLTWLQAIILSMYNLQLREAGKQGFFHWKDHICSTIARNWNSFFGATSRRRSTTHWQGTVAGILSLYSGYVFKSGNEQLQENGWWGLVEAKVPSASQLEVLVKSCHGMKRRGKKTEEAPQPDDTLEPESPAIPEAAMEEEEEEMVWQRRPEDEDSREDLLNTLFNLDDPEDLETFCPTMLDLPDITKPSDFLPKPSGWEILTPRVPVPAPQPSRPPVPDGPTHSVVFLSVYEEGLLLKRLEKLPKASTFLKRLRCKLAVRKRKRERNLPMFDLDAEINGAAPAVADPLTHYFLDRFQNPSCMSSKPPITFLHRLTGSEAKESILSPYSCRTLEPCIHQDFHTRPIKLQLFQELLHKLKKREAYEMAPLTYSFVKPGHITAVNSICHHFFWPGIDMVDCLHYPEFSCIAQYKKLVVGFAFAVPDSKFTEVYIPFIFVHPEWRGSGLATFMMAHLLKESQGKDVTLHVSITNPSRALYENFGFKVETVYLDFYDKYFDHQCKDSRHAYYMRLAR